MVEAKGVGLRGTWLHISDKYTFACSEYFTYSDGPMVVYERYNGCHYDVHWPNRAGCPSLPLIQR